MPDMIREKLIGTWLLEAYRETNIETGEIGHPMGEQPEGFIIYTNDGYMSAQISARGRRPFSGGDMFGGEPAEYMAAGQSYLAYSGPFQLEEDGRKIRHHIAISLFPNWIGQDQVRLVSLQDDKLTLRFEKPALSRGALRDAELVWRRAPAGS